MDNTLVTFVDSIESVGRDDWNSLAGTSNPFTRYEFLHALERTGCTSRESGWSPHHVVVRQSGSNEAGRRPVAVVPLYEKNNSYGEYVFDWSWAHAYQEHGFNYYPKYVTSAPFTPSVGRRLFISELLPEEEKKALIRQVFTTIQDKAEIAGASGWHVLFPTEEEHGQLAALGLMPRIACQFHWFNRDYESFDEFLGSLSSRKRKNIRKERSRVAEAGIQFEHVAGADIDPALWQDFYSYYQSTYLVRGMRGYLSQEFFLEISATMPEQIFLVRAMHEGSMIAAALFFHNEQTLFGRYWGAQADYQFLHFETCYYQGLDYAIAHGLQEFDSGAQGEHKIQRGFEPIITYSNHWIQNTGFSGAIENFLRQEKRHILQYKQDAASLLPFKQEA